MRTPVAILFSLLCAVTACADPAPTHAILDLGSGDEAVIGLHITAEVVREAVSSLPPDCTVLVLTLDSRGGFLAETPALADLLAKELPDRFDVTLLVREASSTAALVAMAAPRLAMFEDGFLCGHTPVERMGDLDLELRGEDLQRSLLVAERCALLGDRPALIARALVTPTPVAIDAEGGLVERATGDTVLSDGQRTLTLKPEDALRFGIAESIVREGDDLAITLCQSGTPSPAAVRAQAVLDEHRRAITERIVAFDTATRDVEELLEGSLDEGTRERAARLLAVIENMLLTDPRVCALRGYDELRVEDLAQRIEAAAGVIP